MKYSMSLGCLAVALLGAGLVRGQAPVPSLPAPELLPPVASPAMLGPPEVVSPPGVSSWLAYPRSPSCCGPVGANGPILSEFYTRAGVSFTLGGGVINGRVNQPGLVLGTGARVLLFNTEADNAWVVDLGVSTVSFNDTNPSPVFLRNVSRTVAVTSPTGNVAGNQPVTQNVQQFFPILPVTPDGVNQTYLNLSIGKERYLWGSATCGQQSRCRVGWDVGGRYGSTRFDIVADRHRTDTVGGFFLAAHSDIEVPCGCCIMQFGGRAEYGYVWSDVLQSHNNTDLNSVSLLLTAGLRF